MKAAMKAITIDCEYLKPQFAAAYLLTAGKEAAFVESNTAHAVPLMLNALQNAGLAPDDVRAIIITHVHLDHAGGASALAKLCPQAKILAHPRAARHLIDPAKLIQSARQVYGDATFEQLYGEITPIPAQRVKAVEDGETFVLGGESLSFLHTKGHANHHMCIHAPSLSGVFTGDAFGLAYPALQKSGLLILPSTSPTDFDPNEALLSVDRIIGTGATRVFLTHYGEIKNPTEAADQLRSHIRFSGSLRNSAAQLSLSGKDLTAFCEQELRRYFENYLHTRGITFSPADWDLLKLDLELNAAGIAFAAERHRSSKSL